MRNLLNIRTAALLAFMALVAIPATGQQRPAPGQGQGPGRGQGQGREWTEDDVKQRVKRQAQALDLTKEQETKVLDFEMELYKTNQVDMQKYRGDREKMREHMTKQREQRDKKYKEILDEEQYNKYKQNQQDRMQNRNPQNRERPQGARPDRGRGR
jgi:Spy/CpxP family protein refolding chaperone